MATAPQRRPGNVALVKMIEERLGALKVDLPKEPMIVGAVGAAMFALDRARSEERGLV